MSAQPFEQFEIEPVEPPKLTDLDLFSIPERCRFCPVVLNLLQKAERLEDSESEPNDVRDNIVSAYRRHAGYVIGHCNSGIDQEIRDRIFGSQTVTVTCSSGIVRNMPALHKTRRFKLR